MFTGSPIRRGESNASEGYCPHPKTPHTQPTLYALLLDSCHNWQNLNLYRAISNCIPTSSVSMCLLKHVVPIGPIVHHLWINCHLGGKTQFQMYSKLTNNPFCPGFQNLAMCRCAIDTKKSHWHNAKSPRLPRHDYVAPTVAYHVQNHLSLSENR